MTGQIDDIACFAAKVLVEFLGREPDADDTRWKAMRCAVAKAMRPSDNWYRRKILEAGDLEYSAGAAALTRAAESQGEVVDLRLELRELVREWFADESILPAKHFASQLQARLNAMTGDDIRAMIEARQKAHPAHGDNAGGDSPATAFNCINAQFGTSGTRCARWCGNTETCTPTSAALDAEDAARYRLLREEGRDLADLLKLIVGLNPGGHGTHIRALRHTHFLDNAIDAAIAQAGE